MIFEQGITPIAIKNIKCKNCSLVELCVPELGRKRNTVLNYLTELIREMEDEITGD